ncbi:uncharacterized protein LOC108949457 [Ciona intestinalis]
MNTGLKELVLYACGKIAQADGARDVLLEVIMAVINSGFCNKICGLISENLIVSMTDSTKAARQVSCCLHLMSKCLDLVPNASANEVSMLTIVVERVVDTMDIGDLENISERLEEVKIRKDEAVRKFMEDRIERSNNSEERLPPDNFRSISVFPTLDDIIETEKPFLRKNRIGVPYDSRKRRYSACGHIIELYSH